MATRIEQKYPVYIETAILNVEKAKEVFPIISNINTYSTVNQTDGKYFSSDLMYSLRKNRSEIPMAFYRNGIMSERSLENFLENNKLYVKPGEYRLRGETLYHGYDSFANYSTDMDGRTTLNVADLFEPFYSNARINFLTSYVYKRENGRLGLITSPKDQGSIDNFLETTDKYIGYDFVDSSELTNLIVNNYIQKEEDSVLKFKSSAPDASDVWLNGNFHLLCEYLGEGKGTANQVFKTKYFPISEAGPDNSNFSDNLTHIGVVSADGSSWDFYEIFESYQAAQQFSEGGNSCYIDRYTGRIYFGRQDLVLPAGIDYIVGNQTGTGMERLITIEGKDWNYLEDSGFIRTSDDGSSFVGTVFQKATQNKIQITGGGGSWSGQVFIHPTNEYFTYPLGKVYAFYTTVMGFEKEVNSSVRKLTEKEIEPWLWVGQKTIAVLAKDKVFPAKITLRALDMPLARRSGNSLVYGPLYYGAEIAILEGEVLSYNDEPIVNQEVTISIKQGPGMLNGSKTINVITNDDGKFYINYYPQENSFTFLKFKDTDITYQGTKTFLRANSSYNDLDLISLGSSGTESCIIYAILKDDGSLGTTGKRHVINAAQYSDYSIYGSLGKIVNLPNRILISTLMSNSGIVFTNFLRDDEVSGYKNGQVTLFDPSLGEYVSLKIKDIVKAPEYWWDGTWDIPNEEAKQSTYVILLDYVSADIYETVTSFDTIWLKKETDVHYDSTLLNGRKCILSELKSPPRTNWKHPNVEGYPSVYGPIMTSFYNGNQNKFTVESVLPTSSSTDPMIDIAGYALIPEKSVVIQAQTTNEDDIIYSNNVEFEIKLNNRDKGVVENILGTFKVPYGFRLIGNGDDSSSTIGTATFLTINKVSGAMPNTTTSTKYPLISRLGVNGIIYLDSANEETVYQPSSSSVKFTISAD